MGAESSIFVKPHGTIMASPREADVMPSSIISRPVHSPSLVSYGKAEVSVVINQELIIPSSHIVAEWSTDIWSCGFHPEAYGEPRQTGHTPDISVSTNIFVWEVKSVIFDKGASDVSSERGYET